MDVMAHGLEDELREAVSMGSVEGTDGTEFELIIQTLVYSTICSRRRTDDTNFLTHHLFANSVSRFFLHGKMLLNVSEDSNIT